VVHFIRVSFKTHITYVGLKVGSSRAQ